MKTITVQNQAGARMIVNATDLAEGKLPAELDETGSTWAEVAAPAAEAKTDADPKAGKAK